ncbi:MAG TPA: ATPase domain-containing protein [Candidatus Eisenbacteria bacterium]|nr:ATPase domain-containing protein [Candidatus Eisenbacteria bacterium]
MSSGNANDLQARAKEKKKAFSWSEAAQLLEKAAAASRKKTEQAEFLESAAHCCSRASQQAGSLAVFTQRRKTAVEDFKEASRLYNEDETEKNMARSSECSMLAEYNQAWLACDAKEKKKVLCDCLTFGEKSSTLYGREGNQLDEGRACISVLRCLFEMLYIASDSAEMAKAAETGIEYADRAIKALANPDNRELLLEAYSLASLQGWYAANICEEPEKAEQLSKRSVTFSEKATQLSASVDDSYLKAMSNWAAAIATLFFTENAQSALEYARKMNEHAHLAKDCYLIGVSCYVLSQVINWIAIRETNSDKKKEWFNEVIGYAQEAVRHLQPMSQDFFIAQVRHFNAESLAILARSAETASKDKGEILEKAVKIGRAGVDNATRSGSPDAMGVTLHALSKTLQFYSNFETRRNAKTALLEEALIHRQGYNEIVKKAFPANNWVAGVGKSYAGLIKKDLAELETDVNNKKARLESAIVDLQDGITRCRRITTQRPISTLIMAVGGFEEGLSNALSQSYRLTGNEACLNDAIGVDQNAADDFKKINAPNRAAECYWRIAVDQNCLGEHRKASEAFAIAFSEYEDAVKLMPDFSGFYMEYAAYMRAWSEIEKATFAHEKEQYHEAEEHFQKVSSILSSSKLWNYFAPNFMAWSLLEQGEDLSRKEKTPESLEAFKKAVELFKKARQAFEKTIDRIKSPDEKEKAVELSKACIRRADYCSVREYIEAAKIDDRNGKHADSADKYGSAASLLEKMLKNSENETERRDIAPFNCMVRAWQRMKMADARASAELYSQASELFSEAREHSLEETQNFLASGNSAVCKALEHGTLFEETREKTEFSKAKKYLESASSFYLKAGLENASAWTTATEILLDAYNYLTDAETEGNVTDKSKMLMLAEKCLEQSAKLYESANYIGRRDEALRISAKVKQKREFALTLGELLKTPGEASTTKAIPAPSPTIEEPVGLQKFERELIEANLVAAKKDLLLAEDFSLELHVANLGKAPAFLTLIEDMLPEGIDPTAESEVFAVENHDLNMKGKRLDPSKSETLRLEVRSFQKGVYHIKPRVVCVDETGRQVLCEVDPLSVNVTESTLPNRVATGNRNLDLLLLGGIPEKFAVLLTSPSFDERASLIRGFLESGAAKGEVTFQVAVDLRGTENLAERFKNNFLFICNPKANEIIKDMPNVVKLKGIENLTEISIALTSTLRNLGSSTNGHRRLCLEIISDVLLHHHAVSTRRWLTSLMPELRAHGFTTLAVLNPQMHSSQDIQAVLDIFDGEISLRERETRKGTQKLLAVVRLSGERHLKSEIPFEEAT